MSACPSDLKLEALLLGADPAAAGHLATCAACQARLAEMRAAGAEFEREVYPATVARVTAAATARRRPRRWIAVAAPLAAAAALLAVVLVRQRAAPRLDLAVYVEEPTGTRAVRDGDEVPASASLRFEVHPASPCCLWVLSVDATGDIARLYPPKGDHASEAIVHPAERHALPTAAALDGRGGPARIFAVCTPSPVPWPTLKGAAAERLQRGDEAVRRLRALGGMPAGSAQASVLVDKRT